MNVNTLPKSPRDSRVAFTSLKRLATRFVPTRLPLKKSMRQSAGERLFSKAAIVIPIFPETNKDDIDWLVVEKLKKLAYGSIYRPKQDLYEKIIKVFAAGQLLEHEKTNDSWKDIAKNFELPPATVRYIYDRAHEIVYGRPAKKRHYGKEEEISSPDSPDYIPKDPGPSLRQKLTKEGVVEKYERHGYQKKDGVIRQFDDIFDDISDGLREKCSKC